MGAEKGLKAAETVFLALLTLGLIGLLFLIIYGNLSTNLGWSPDSTNYVNQTINLSSAGATPAGAQNRVDASLSSVIVVNASNGSQILDTANYTITGVVINSTGTVAKYHFHDHNVNTSYIVSYDGSGEINTEAVISNLTSGATEFFTFSGVWFVLTAITILIGIVLGVIALVRRTSTGGFGGKKGRSEFAS